MIALSSSLGSSSSAWMMPEPSAPLERALRRGRQRERHEAKGGDIAPRRRRHPDSCDVVGSVTQECVCVSLQRSRRRSHLCPDYCF